VVRLVLVVSWSKCLDGPHSLAAATRAWACVFFSSSRLSEPGGGGVHDVWTRAREYLPGRTRCKPVVLFRPLFLLERCYDKYVVYVGGGPDGQIQ